MYGQESGGMLAATGTGIMIGSQHFGSLAIASIGGVLILIGTALIVAYRRTRRIGGKR